MGSESDVATDWKTHLIIGKNFITSLQNVKGPLSKLDDMILFLEFSVTL